MWRIGEMLIQKKLISWDQLQDALIEQEKSKEMIGTVLVRKRYISQTLLYKSLAEQHQIRFVDLKRTKVNPKAVELIPQEICQKNQIIPIEVSENALTLGISNMPHFWPESEIKELTGFQNIRTVLCLPEDIEQAIQENYSAKK